MRASRQAPPGAIGGRKATDIFPLEPDRARVDRRPGSGAGYRAGLRGRGGTGGIGGRSFGSLAIFAIKSDTA